MHAANNATHAANTRPSPATHPAERLQLRQHHHRVEAGLALADTRPPRPVHERGHRQPSRLLSVSLPEQLLLQCSHPSLVHHLVVGQVPQVCTLHGDLHHQDSLVLVCDLGLFEGVLVLGVAHQALERGDRLSAS